MSLQNRVAARIAAWPGRASFAYTDLRTGDGFTVQSSPSLTGAASTNKIAALVELMRQHESGIVDLESTIYVTDDDFPSGGSPMRPELPGTYTVKNLADRMIHDSDNTATNVIMTLVGRENIRVMLDSIGVDRAMIGPYAYLPDAPGVRWNTDHWEYTMVGYQNMNKTNAGDLNRLLQAIWDSDVVSDRSLIIDVMLGTRDSSRLRGGLPATFPIAHKAGAVSGGFASFPSEWEGWVDGAGVSNDSGIVMLDGLEYAISVCAEGVTAEGSALIRELSALVFDSVAGGVDRRPVTNAYMLGGTVEARMP